MEFVIYQYLGWSLGVSECGVASILILREMQKVWHRFGYVSLSGWSLRFSWCWLEDWFFSRQCRLGSWLDSLSSAANLLNLRRSWFQIHWHRWFQVIWRSSFFDFWFLLKHLCICHHLILTNEYAPWSCLFSHFTKLKYKVASAKVDP